MKFGKSIRSEARNNRGLSFINFKYLKRIVKRCGAAVRAGAWDAAREEDRQFWLVLESELRKVGESYWKELQQISNLQASITQKLPFLDIQPDPETYTRMGFEQLQAHLQSLGGLDEVPSSRNCSASSVKTSAALCEFCVNLGKISARCKRLRRCVLWNAVAVVKILKKRQKLTSLAVNREAFPFSLIQWECQSETAVQVLSRQGWYCCDQLPKIVSIVETTTGELMQRLTLTPPNRDQYQCPICLEVVVDPVCLRTCGHRFCWACLCMAYCEKAEGTLERCPCCRAAFPLDPEAFEVDGILSRFLRDFFPEDQSARMEEQKENLRQRLEVVQRQQEEQRRCLNASVGNDNGLASLSSVVEETDNHHCCPDCIIDGHEESISTEFSTRPTVALFDSLTKLSLASPTCTTLNGPLIRCAAEWLSSQDRDPGKTTHTKKHLKGCCHELNVKQGKPSDVDHLAFTSSTQGTSSSEPSPAFFSPSFTATLELPFTPTTSSTSKLLCSVPPSPNARTGSIRPAFSSAGYASYASSNSHAQIGSVDTDRTVIDSVVAALLCESPLSNSTPNTSSSSGSNSDDQRDFCPDFPLLPAIIPRPPEDPMMPDDAFSDHRLPFLIVDHSEIINDDEFDQYYYYHESVDDDDDRIEQDLLDSKHWNTSQNDARSLLLVEENSTVIPTISNTFYPYPDVATLTSP